MLTFESLIDTAKEKGMPTGKTRGILREYLQVLILKEMYKLPLGKNLYFTGGTYLRLVHQTKRFSEDLDFNVDKMSKNDFENTLEKISNALEKEGLKAKLIFNHWDNLFVSELIFFTSSSLFIEYNNAFLRLTSEKMDGFCKDEVKLKNTAKYLGKEKE